MYKQTLSSAPAGQPEAVTIMPVASSGFGHSVVMAPVSRKT